MSETKHGPVLISELDWAERKAREVAHSLPPSDFGSHRAIMSFAAALRDVVKAEREACAKIADDSASRWDSQPDDDCASIACGDIAAAIRARTP